MKRIATQLALLALLAPAGCFSTTDDDDFEPPPDDVPAACSAASRAQRTVVISGHVVDFATSAPVAGASVDIGTAWDGTEDSCPTLATVTTASDGSFGPINVKTGAHASPVFVLFRVHGADRAQTMSDNRTCMESQCNLSHTIAAPSKALAASWRTELVAGGMSTRAARGLVAFQFTANNIGAAGVAPSETLFTDPPTRALVPGVDVRFLDADRSALLPASQSTTGASGLALVGASNAAFIYLSGTSTNASWPATGCLVDEDWIFLEDRARTP